MPRMMPASSASETESPASRARRSAAQSFHRSREVAFSCDPDIRLR